jgi:hypothetical protein
VLVGEQAVGGAGKTERGGRAAEERAVEEESHFGREDVCREVLLLLHLLSVKVTAGIGKRVRGLRHGIFGSRARTRVRGCRFDWSIKQCYSFSI